MEIRLVLVNGKLQLHKAQNLDELTAAAMLAQGQQMMIARLQDQARLIINPTKSHIEEPKGNANATPEQADSN